MMAGDGTVVLDMVDSQVSGVSCGETTQDWCAGTEMCFSQVGG